MLGAATSGAVYDTVSIPPKAKELTAHGFRDWNTGMALIKTCMDTHDTATYVILALDHQAWYS